MTMWLPCPQPSFQLQSPYPLGGSPLTSDLIQLVDLEQFQSLWPASLTLCLSFAALHASPLLFTLDPWLGPHLSMFLCAATCVGKLARVHGLSE